MLSIEETLALAEEDPEFTELSGPLKVFGALNGWSMDTDISEQREMLAQARENMPKPDPSSLPCTVEDIQITVRDGTAIQVRIYKPRDAPTDGSPGLVIYHGGGFCVGDADIEAWLCKMFAELGGIAVDIQYRHAPEHPFPVPIEDSIDGLKWIGENYGSLGIDPKKGLIIGGESAGADITLAVAHLYRDEKGLPPLTGLYVAFNSAMSRETVPEKYKDHFLAMEQNAQALLFNAESLEFVRRQYKPDLKSPLASPVLFDHVGIPKTYFAACGADPLRDHTLIYEQVWRDEGIPTRLDIYPGIPHAGWVFFPESSFAKKHVEDSRGALRWLLSS